MTESRIRIAFAEQAISCRRLGSPFTGAVVECLGERIDETTRTGRKVLGWTGDPSSRADSVPLRLAGALHALVRSGRVPLLERLYPPRSMPEGTSFAAALADAISEHDDWVADFLDNPPQTNEIGRSGLLYPGLMTVARLTGLPLALHEIGSSAGLNLILDRFCYTLGEYTFGDPASVVHLKPAWMGAAPEGPQPTIVNRRGCDQAPINIADALARDRLMAYIWPDQPERLERTAAAIELALKDPPDIDRCDAADWVEALAASTPQPGVARVLMHSISFQYFPAHTQRRIAEAMAMAGAAASRETPLARLSFELEGDAFTLRLRLWPYGLDNVLATGDAHGWRVQWFDIGGS
jgi:hypothetical protein